jgi:excisionase family DNA binding protein
MAIAKVEKQFLKPIEAAEAIGVSRTKIYEAIQRGQVPAIRIAGMIRVPRAWVDDQVKVALAGAAEGERNDD